MTAFVTTKEACRQIGVHPNTLRQWDKEGKIRTQRTPGGKRLYDTSSVLKGKGKIHKIGGKKVMKCECGIEVSRDYNGARGILLNNPLLPDTACMVGVPNNVLTSLCILKVVAKENVH